MINDLILRVTYNGVTTDLDVDGDVPLRIDMSTVETQDFGKLFGIGSQKFNLPGTSNNNKFFKHAYDVAAEDVPAFYNTLPVSVILNGENLLLGRLQLMEVITSDGGYITYSVQVVDKVVQFDEALNGLLIKNADFSAYDHTFNSASILASWDDNLLSGSIFYPLAEYGGQNESNGLSYATFSSGSNYALSTTRAWDTGLHPYTPSQFLPAIKAKDLLTVIFDQAGFAYTGSFTETTDFTSLYVLPKGQDGIGPVANPDLEATFEATDFGQAFTTASIANTQIEVTTEVSDPLGQYTSPDSYYTAGAAGDYIFRGSVSFNNPTFTTTDIVTYTLQLVKGIYPGSATVIDTAQITTNVLVGPAVISLAVGGKHTLNANDDVWMLFTKTVGGVPFTVTAAEFGCSTAPPNVVGTTLDMALQFQADTKSVDILKGFIQQFNLVMTPTKNDSRTIQIDTFDTWIRSGEVKDWTTKYNTAERIGINHTVDDLAKETFLKNADDVDRFSKVTIESQPNDQFGTLRLLADNNISLGEDTIGDFFAPVILSGPFEVGTTPADLRKVSQSFDFDISINDNTLFPHLYKLENKLITSYAFKPRLGYKVSNQVQYPYIINIGDIAGPKTVVSGSYATLSNVAALPVITGETNDILFNNTYTPFTEAGMNFNNSKTNYDRYWKTYYESLYWDNAVIVTMDLFFEPNEFHTINLNDNILVNNIYYRINKIKGFNVTRRDVVTVELIRLYPAYSPIIGVDDPVLVCPEVVTYEPALLTSSSLTMSGSVISSGSLTVTERGFVFSATDSTPTITDTVYKTGSGQGLFDYPLAGLNPGSTYYHRAYASSSLCLEYGVVKTINTLTSSACPTVDTVSGSVLGPYKFNMLASTLSTGSGIVERGFTVSPTDSSPEIGETNVYKLVQATGSAAEPAESWTYTATGSVETFISHSQLYYYSAYVSGSGCIDYGPVLNLTTGEPTSSCVSNPFSASVATNFGAACSEEILYLLYTDYDGTWPPTQAYLDGGGTMKVYAADGCSHAVGNTYYAFDSSSAAGTDNNGFLRTNDDGGTNPGNVIAIFNCE